ncbi:hypothetical protein EB796_016440 [Bugula neritina]|uniref:Uncharacterized protein n=1 Tax=Bugula neritina TaxID=10212 RepID=A0A7J7JG79_BUGNE|nr:hypothetical protein EB796_016440 [Bugula neritina]
MKGNVKCKQLVHAAMNNTSSSLLARLQILGGSEILHFTTPVLKPVIATELQTLTTTVQFLPFACCPVKLAVAAPD